MRHRSLIIGALVVTSTLLASGAGAAAKNLIVTPAVRASIFDAAAKYHQLPTKDYVGLQPHMTYYAFDSTNDTYYAAAGLVASPHSLKAQVGTQDDGGYNLFTRKATSRTWRVYDDGLGGAQDSVCPIKIPATVLKVWNWKAGSCFPPT